MEPIIFTKNYAQPPVNRREILRYMRCTDAGDTFDDLLDACLAELLPQLVYKVILMKVNLQTKKKNNIKPLQVL